MSFKFEDNSEKVKAQMAKNIDKALIAIGTKQVEIATMEIRSQPRMRNKVQVGIGMIDSGDMIAANTFTQPQNKEIIVGNTAHSDRGAPYPLFVTMGTWKMPARPWFQNSIQNYTEDYEAVARAALSEGF